MALSKISYTYLLYIKKNCIIVLQKNMYLFKCRFTH